MGVEEIEWPYVGKVKERSHVELVCLRGLRPDFRFFNCGHMPRVELDPDFKSGVKV
jgi:hypothetical protein